jgi:hypothetical protein
MKSKWDELQTQAQQMQEVHRPLLVCLTSNMFLGIIGILTWGWGSFHKVHGHNFKKMTTLLKQFEQVELPMQSLSKLHGVLKIGYQNLISATEQMKWM